MNEIGDNPFRDDLRGTEVSLFSALSSQGVEFVSLLSFSVLKLHGKRLTEMKSESMFSPKALRFMSYEPTTASHKEVIT